MKLASYILVDAAGGGFRHITPELALTLYMDYKNNFLTIECFAEKNYISFYSAKTFIEAVNIAVEKYPENCLHDIFHHIIVYPEVISGAD